MHFDVTEVAAIAGRAANDNMRSICAGIERRGEAAGLLKPHRMAHYLAQLGHESAGFKYDREIWGPTAAQSRYDTRTDLGNTPERDGDGELYKGRTGGQITGRANYAAFTDWVWSFDPAAPDFVADPDAINTDPWEGLGPIWYWEVGNPTRKPLSRYADENDVEMITRRWNGGLNGYADRLAWYSRAALVLLGYARGDVSGFQGSAGLAVDGVAGPRTRAALHRALEALPELEMTPSGGGAPTNNNELIAHLEAALRLAKA